MKRKALLINYLTFFVLLLTLLFTSSEMLELGKYLLLILGGVMLYRITSADVGVRAFHLFNFLYIGFVVSFVLYASLYRTALFGNIITYLLVATILGFVLSLVYREPRRGEVQKKLPPKHVHEKKEEKPAVIRPVKKSAAKKKPAKKKTAKKKSAKKKVAKKSAKKKSAKKKAPAKKKPTKKKVAKKSARKKVAKKSAKKKSAKKATAKRGRPAKKKR